MEIARIAIRGESLRYGGHDEYTAGLRSETTPSGWLSGVRVSGIVGIKCSLGYVCF